MLGSGIGPEQQVINVRQELLRSYDELFGALNGFQNRFVDEMANKWACSDAVTFFGTVFPESINMLSVAINQQYAELFAKINQVLSLSSQTWNISYQPINFTQRNIVINAGAIRENINGVRGIDKTSAMTVKTNLSVIQNNASSALDIAKNAVINNHECFGNNTEILLQKIVSIVNYVNSVINEVTIATENAINATIDHYEDTNGKIAQILAS